MEHSTYLFQRLEKGVPTDDDVESPDEDDQGERRFELFIRLKDDDLVQLTGKHRGNYALKEVVELYINDVSFGVDGLADEYCAWRKGELEITMNPKRYFGEPLTPSRYTAHVLWDAVRIEGSIDKAAEAYGVDRTEVELAYSYVDSLKVPPSGR